MNKFVITEDMLKILLNYLAQRPYGEVAKIIYELQQLEVIQDEA